MIWPINLSDAMMLSSRQRQERLRQQSSLGAISNDAPKRHYRAVKKPSTETGLHAEVPLRLSSSALLRPRLGVILRGSPRPSPTSR